MSGVVGGRHILLLQEVAAPINNLLADGVPGGPQLREETLPSPNDAEAFPYDPVTAVG